MNDVVMGMQLGRLAGQAVNLIRQIGNGEEEIEKLLLDDFCDLVRKGAGGEGVEERG